VVEVTVDEAIEEMAYVEPALPACGIQVANDVDRAAVAQEMIPFRRRESLIKLSTRRVEGTRRRADDLATA